MEIEGGMDGICVEIETIKQTCDGNRKKLFYEAILVDKNGDDQAIVCLKNNLRDKINVDFSCVHLAHKKDEILPNLKKESEIDVFFEDQHCWEHAVVKNTKDNIVAVIFDDNAENFVLLANVRSARKGPSITSDDIYVFELPVPNKFSNFAGDPAVHSLFLTSIKAEFCIYVPDDSKLKIISIHEDSARFGKTLFDFHLECLEQRLKCKSAIENMKEFHKKLQEERTIDQFEMNESLTGLAIGKHGSNILKARFLPGIKHVEVQQNTIYIIGENKECVAKARSLLEFKHDFIFIPRYLKKKIITKTFMEHVQKNNFVNIKIRYVYSDEDDASDDDTNIPHISNHCTILMTGLAENIAAVKLQIEFLVATHMDAINLQRQLNILPQYETSHEEKESGDAPPVNQVDDVAEICQDDTSNENDTAIEKFNRLPYKSNNIRGYGRGNHNGRRPQNNQKV